LHIKNCWDARDERIGREEMKKKKQGDEEDGIFSF